MTEELHGQIDVKQQEIETLKGPAEAQKKIREYRGTYVSAVDSGQMDLKAAAGKLKSPEAQAFLTKASGEIARHLTSMATRGREIIKAHEDTKKGETPAEVPSMDALSGKLKAQLGGLKKSIKSFTVLEELETKDLKAIADANDKLNSSPGTADPLKIFAAKDKLLVDLSRLGPKFMGTTDSSTYAKKVSDIFRKLAEQLKEEKTELAMGPMARHIIAQDFFKEVATYETLVKQAESNPSIDTLRAVEAQAGKIDPTKAHADIFGERDTGTTAFIENMYTHLQTEYDASTKKFEDLKKGFDETEKLALTKAAEKMIAEVETAEKETIAPLWEKYEPLSRRTDLSGKELEAYEQSEKGLMAAYLTLKMTMSPFANQETQFKLQGDVYKQVQAKITAIDNRVRQIEVNRQTRKSMASLGEVGANVFSYVTFLEEEKDGKIYKFNAAYDALSDDKKQEVRMAVESIIARDQAAVKSETQKAMVELSKSSGNFDAISDVLGEKSKKYAEGLKLLASGKHTEAVAAFEAYVGQSFSDEERELNSVALADAKEKVSLIKYSGDFYEGLQKYGTGDINGAAKSLTAYVKWAEGSAGAPELHQEQVSQAREVLHLIGLSKVKQLDDLLEDVKVWKKKDLQDQYGSGGQKVDFKISGPEVDIIVNGIDGLKQKVQKGELLDYDEEFSKLKASVHLYLQKHALDPKNNVIDKFSELYEGMNSTDPKVRKATCLKFAKELRELRGYDKAREYLDKALAEDYREASKEVSQEKVMQEMLENKMVMDNVRKAAAAYLERFKKENPDVPEDQLRQQAEQIVFNMWLKNRYSRELRQSMTAKGFASTDEALRLYNDWSPYEENKDTSWYKPWNYEYMNAEEWDQFKDAAKQNLAMTIATLPIGLGAGAIGAQIGKVAFRAIATKLLVRTGAAGAEVAIAAIEQGGIQAIKFGSQTWKVLTPQMQRAVILSRLGAGALSVTAEGAFLLGGSTVAEGLITGESTPITSANLVESIFKAMAFRGIGMGGSRIFGKALEAGGKRGAAAFFAMESLSGIAGTGVEAAGLYMKGHGEHVDTGFVLRSLLENAITSTGMHLAHGYIGKGPREGRNKVEEAYNKKVAAEAEGAFEVKFKDPTTIRTARITPEGHVVINGKVIPDFTVEVLAALPKKTRQHIESLTAPHGAPKNQPSADIPGLKKRLENMDLPEAQRKQIESTIAKFERAEMNAHELDAAIHASFNESRKIQIPDPDHPGQMKEVDLHSDYKTKNFAYSPEMTNYLNDYTKLQSDGPIIVKHGGDEIVILHAGPDGKVQMFFGDVGNMGPSNDFSLRVKGGNANLVDLYLRDLAGIIKAEFKPGQPVDGPHVLGRIKNELAQKYFGIKTEAAFNVIKEQWGIEGTWQDYQQNLKNANILAGFRSDARSLQSEFLKQYPEADSAIDVTRDNAAFAKFVGEKIAGLDKGSPPLTDVLRSNLDAFEKSGALSDLLPTGLDSQNQSSISRERLESILAKKERSAEEQLILYYALRRVNSKSLPQVPGVDTTTLGKRFSRIRQPDSAATLMDFQMAGVDVPKFNGRPVNHTDMKFFLDKVLEDALHAAKEKKGSLDIEHAKSPFDAEGRIPPSDMEMAAAYKEAAKDAKPQEVKAFLEATQNANKKIQEIQEHIQYMASKDNPSQPDIVKLQRLKSKYDAYVAEINQRKFSDPETGADRPGKFAEDASFWLPGLDGQQIPTEHHMFREFTIDMNNTGAINAQRGYAVTDAAMATIAKELKRRFPYVSSIVRTGGGEFRLFFFDKSKLPKIGGEILSVKEHQALIASALPEINAKIHEVLDPNGRTYVDGVVRDATSHFRSRPAVEGGVGQVMIKGSYEIPPSLFREALSGIGHPRSLFRIREYRHQGAEFNNEVTSGQAQKYREALIEKYPDMSEANLDAEIGRMAETIETIRRELGEHKYLVQVLEKYVLDVDHPMNIISYLKNPKTRMASIEALRSMASGKTYNLDQMRTIVAQSQKAANDIYHSDDAEFNIDVDGRNRSHVLREKLLATDETLFSTTDKPTIEQRRKLESHATRLREDIMPQLVEDLNGIAGPKGTDGFPAVNARAKSADGIVDKIHRMRGGNAGKAPRENYTLADVPDAVGGRITVRNMKNLAEVMQRLEAKYGKENIYEKDNFYSSEKKSKGPYRVVTYTVMVKGVPCEVQITTLMSSMAADLWHNTGYKKLHPDLPPEAVDTMGGIQRTVATREHKEAA